MGDAPKDLLGKTFVGAVASLLGSGGAVLLVGSAPAMAQSAALSGPPSDPAQEIESAPDGLEGEIAVVDSGNSRKGVAGAIVDVYFVPTNGDVQVAPVRVMGGRTDSSGRYVAAGRVYSLISAGVTEANFLDLYSAFVVATDAASGATSIQPYEISVRGNSFYLSSNPSAEGESADIELAENALTSYLAEIGIEVPNLPASMLTGSSARGVAEQTNCRPSTVIPPIHNRYVCGFGGNPLTAPVRVQARDANP